jgi:hypothetical protein
MKTRNLALCAALPLLAALLSFALRLAAQQAVPPVAKQMVPIIPLSTPLPSNLSPTATSNISPWAWNARTVTRIRNPAS